jgi:hypothetical protein
MRRTMALIAVALLASAAAPHSAGAQVSSAAVPAESLLRALDAFAITEEGIAINGKVSRGNTTIAAGDTVHGPLLVIGGTADISGLVAGSVYALWGDVLVHTGAEVAGTASAYRGRVIVDGGRVRGELNAWPAAVAAAVAQEPPMTRSRALQLATGWTAVLVVVGILILVLMSPNIEGTARALEQDFGRSFFLGVVGQLGFLPALLILCVALAATIVGLLLIPFVLVAAPVALMGLVTLGWLALALMSGRALLRSRHDGSSRAEALRALVLGAVVLMAPWIIAALLQGTGTTAFVLRIAAVAVTWVAATAGLGAAMLSRAGAGDRKMAERAAPPLQGWQTPTPVAGVAAARRPIPARPGATPQ